MPQSPPVNHPALPHAGDTGQYSSGNHQSRAVPRIEASSAVVVPPRVEQVGDGGRHRGALVPTPCPRSVGALDTHSHQIRAHTIPRHKQMRNRTADVPAQEIEEYLSTEAHGMNAGTCQRSPLSSAPASA